MALFVRVEQIAAHRGRLAAVVDRYQRGEPSFIDAALAWIAGAEATLARLRLADAATLAALRGAIARAGDEVEGEPGGRRPRALIRRARDVAAARALEQADALLRERAAEATERLRHFEDKLIEAMTAGALVELVPPRPTSSDGEGAWTRWVAAIWQNLSQHRATRPTTLYLAAALCPADRLHLVDRVAGRLTDGDAPVGSGG